MGVDVDEGDTKKPIEEHCKELVTEELKGLQMQQHTQVFQEMGDVKEVIYTTDLKECRKCDLVCH